LSFKNGTNGLFERIKENDDLKNGTSRFIFFQDINICPLMDGLGKFLEEFIKLAF